MRDSASAIWNFQVAVSYFTAQRLLSMLPMANWGPLRSAQERCYEAGEAAKKNFRTNTMMFAAFQFADKAQSDFARLAKDTMTLKVLTPEYMTRVASLVFQGSTDAYESVGSDEARSLLREQFQNTGDVIGYVNHPDAPDKLSADGTYPLEQMVDKAYLRGDYPALWLLEGLGERYAHACMGGRDVRGLLTSGKGAELPDKTQLMMHAGMGIAFAKDIVAGLTPWSTRTKVKDALRRFLDLVRQNSIAGCEGAAIESLGLVTRTWHGQLVTLISDELLEMDADATEFFWHGAGRAMYFSPMYMLPGLSPFDAAEREPPDDTARRNARAGVTWAFTIVNVRQPKIAAHFVHHKSDRVSGNDAFTNGVHSTLVMAGDMVPGHRYVADYCKFQPEAGEEADAWDRHIGRNIGEKIDRYRRVLKTHHKLGEVFRCHDLEDLVEDLDR